MSSRAYDYNHHRRHRRQYDFEDEPGQFYPSASSSPVHSRPPSPTPTNAAYDSETESLHLALGARKLIVIVVAATIIIMSLVSFSRGGGEQGNKDYDTLPPLAFDRGGRSGRGKRRARFGGDAQLEAAMASICRAHEALNALAFARQSNWPTLDEFIAIKVDEEPFVTTKTKYTQSTSTTPNDLAKQEAAILRGWVTAYESLLSASGSKKKQRQRQENDNDASGRVADAMALVASTLQDADARTLYLYDLLPRMRKAGADGVAKRFGKGVKADDPSQERERKRIIKEWLGNACIPWKE
ncbi:hypothetical protein CTA1_3138 [Colletotrichum tanaceti]|uniref:Uncharacterized protein n=1 Tax=Colletotrichum tanaceti TaxID=1306861 RepID=A0A4U6XVG8_9PEZI|nr:hypothetical protein CTA1_3138 [Colletotrichum tanaceti]